MTRRETPLRTPVGSGPGGILAGLLVLADLVLIAVHVRGDTLGQPRDWPWWVDVDGGYPEFMQYVKLLWVVLLLGIAWLRWRRWAWLALAFTALALLADDALGMHEQFGPAVGALVPLPAALADFANDIGEALVMAAMGGVLLLAVLAGYRVADRRTREWLRPIMGLLVLLAAFAGVIDPLHQTTEGLLYSAVTVVEDGGEMIVVSLLAATAFHTAVHAADLTDRRPGRGPGAPRFGRGPGVLLLALLLTVDVVLIGTHVNANIVGEPPEWPWWVDVDGGGPEFWQYVKFVWGALSVLVVWWMTRRAVWLLTVLPFVAMLLDDSLTLHEQYGEQAGALLPIPPTWLDYQQFFGEFALLVVVGGVLLLTILVAAFATHDRPTRRLVWPFVALLVLMAAFAGAVDLLHQWTDGTLYEVVTLVEDGGEMLVASGLLAWAFHLATLPRGVSPEAAADVEDDPPTPRYAPIEMLRQEA